ncbi:hypothetical protein FGB62_87g048 [Gracilaria domingensis]|nr:hypothetical protein FGB62_87g048 [Gracilaria domingensis]
MLHTLNINEPSSTQTSQEAFFNAADRVSLRDAIALAFTCKTMLEIFRTSLTGVKLVSSWQTEQRTLISACKIAATTLRAIHLECSAPVSPALKHVTVFRPPIRHFVLIGVNISKLLLSDLVCNLGPSLHKLVISAAAGLDDGIVDIISFHCPKLRFLELGGSRRVTSRSLNHMFERIGHNLEGLELSGLYHESYSNHVLATVAKHCKRLTSLRLLKLTWVSDYALQLLFKLRAYHLTEFHVERCSLVTVHTLCAVAQYCTGLERLFFSLDRDRLNWGLVSLPPLLEPLNSCSLHNTFESSNYNVGESAVIRISRRCRNLQRVSLCELKLSDLAIEQISHACGSNLRALSLRNCSGITDAALLSLAENVTSLTSLDVSHNPYLTDQGLSTMLAALKHNLEELHVIGCKGLTDALLRRVIPKFAKRLRIIRLSYCNYSIQAVASIKEALPRLALHGGSPGLFH